MSTITRMWLGFAALGAGIIHLALIVSSPAPIAILIGLLGLAELAWGVVTFVRRSILLPRIALFGSLAPIVLWGVLVAAAAASHTPAISSYLGFEAMFAATVLDLFIAIVIAFQLRRGTDFNAPTRESSAPRYLIGVFVGGLIAALIVTPALSATDAGKYAKNGDFMGMHMGAPTLVIHK
jgi:hypothetical protein